jgi:ATP-dependent DNA helicase PIF1
MAQSTVSSMSLNGEQQRVFSACTTGSSSVFCTGQGGTGKSLLLSSVVDYLKSRPGAQGGSVAITASTGVAAQHISGITLHRFAGIGIEEDDLEVMIANASKPHVRRQWAATDILIIDEISMISATLFSNLSLLAKEMRGSDKPFGGIRLLMFGDFLQLPPVSPGKKNVSHVFETDTWTELNPQEFELTTVVRQSDPRFRDILDELRLGICTASAETYIRSLSREVPTVDGIEPVKLHALKAKVSAYNTERLTKLTTDVHTYDSIDIGQRNILKQCPAEQSLSLKKGAQVMLIRNLSSTAVNGSVGTITDFVKIGDSKVLYPKVLMALPNGTTKEMHISPVEWRTTLPNGKTLANRIQVPLVLAWAITIHKSQGQTIPLIEVDMAGVFAPGQAYVALSRCTSPHTMRVLNFSKELVHANRVCVAFYCRLRARADEHNNSMNSPTELVATNVASDTTTEWVNHTPNMLQQLENLSLTQTYQDS